MHKDKAVPDKGQTIQTGDILQRENRRIRGIPLSPLRSIIVITETGLSDFSPDQISAERLGVKAYGLSSIPSEWVPPYFVITASCIGGNNSDETINAWVSEALIRLCITSNRVMVRSSGQSETIRNRGRLVSESCSPDQVVTTIKKLISQISTEGVHWIVQDYIESKRMGHLSNERHLKEEKRDWVVEFEPSQDRPSRTESIAIRRWRDGIEIPNLDLPCTSDLAISFRLKRVAMWATRLSSRNHFEWVWDGEAIRIVQIEEAEPIIGVKPQSLLPDQINSFKPPDIKLFRPAGDEDFERYPKLWNARLYRQLGYTMPVFYVLNDPDVMSKVLSGSIPHKLENDLFNLTNRPLIIRTDGASIPSSKREMLPRSDELRSYKEAMNWLINYFNPQIKQTELAESGLCLIAHHFIPSAASAWARAEPRNRIVRIESLWGIPEGLYWYSHDTFEVDTKTIGVEFGKTTLPLKYKYWKRLRHKGTYIASNEDGKWIPFKTAPPYDWNKSISKEDWLFEIAKTTRQIAEFEKNAVSVMWFIDNHPQATEHKVLPWFHSKSEIVGNLKAAPRKKRKSVRDICIKSTDDWQQLKQSLRVGSYVERVVVKPEEIELIRNPQFAEELASLAATYRFVIELSGGILSHVYYILQSQGAQVECADLFGASEDVVEYGKIVRDKIPTLIEGGGERTETVQLQGDALVVALRQKLVEEAFEVLDAKSGEDLINELADIQEVVRALCRTLDLNTTEMEAERKQKEKSRGGFEKGLMLIKTVTPHSIQKQPTILNSAVLELKQQSSEPTISDETNLPVKPLYRRPDLRQVKQQPEKLFTFELETNKIGEVKETLNFSIPIDNQRSQEFTLTVEFRRTRASLRGVVSIRLRPSQLQIDFPE